MVFYKLRRKEKKKKDGKKTAQEMTNAVPDS